MSPTECFALQYVSTDFVTHCLSNQQQLLVVVGADSGILNALKDDLVIIQNYYQLEILRTKQKKNSITLTR